MLFFFASAHSCQRFIKMWLRKGIYWTPIGKHRLSLCDESSFGNVSSVMKIIVRSQLEVPEKTCTDVLSVNDFIFICQLLS